MQQRLFRGLLASLALAFGLVLAASGTASASGPAQGSVASAKASAVGSAGVATGVGTLADRPCGYSAPNANAYYNHCGGGRISVTVEFWWGVQGDRIICVGPGVTNLSTHYALQNGLITYAYYNGNGC